jgi:hypothetical protein
MTMGLLLTQTMTAQVHDEEKYLQWRSMETGPLGFEPKLYYWLFHNNYAHHEWEWEWHGFKSGLYLHLKPDESDAKPVVPKRTLGATTDLWTKESTDSQEKDFKHQLEQETLAAADRRVDAAYLLFKDDFDNMQNKISAGLTYCLANCKGDANVISIVNSLSNQNRFITEQVSYVHKSGNGYELENAKREECYIKLKADMEKVTQSTIDLMRYVEVSK